MEYHIDPSTIFTFISSPSSCLQLNLHHGNPKAPSYSTVETLHSILYKYMASRETSVSNVVIRLTRSARE